MASGLARRSLLQICRGGGILQRASVLRAYGTSAPRVSDRLVDVVAVDTNGERHTVKGLTGQSILTTLVNAGLETRDRHPLDQLPSCTGNCEVLIPNEWLQKLPPPSEEERERLESVAPGGRVDKHARLGCQVALTSDLNGIVVAKIEDRAWRTL